jgi:hypothetical protein
MKQLEHAGIGEKPFEIGRVILIPRQLHEMRSSIASGELNETEPVAPWNETERLGVDSNACAEDQTVREIAFVEFDFHACQLAPSLSAACGSRLFQN